jgi:hypothetical protein
MRIHADPDPKHASEQRKDENPTGKSRSTHTLHLHVSRLRLLTCM